MKEKKATRADVSKQGILKDLLKGKAWTINELCQETGFSYESVEHLLRRIRASTASLESYRVGKKIVFVFRERKAGESQGMD
ncbi:MAG: hypothetical protein ACXQTL_02290 [Methanosarcinales archaeon]